MRWADFGLLGGSRERAERRPRSISLAPMILGTAGLVSTPMVAHQNSDPTIYLLPVSFLYTMLGLLWVGPALIWWVARGGRTLARSAAQVIDLNRITQHPRAVFRAAVDVVVTVYVMTVFVVAITAAAGTHDVIQGGEHLSLTSLKATPTVSNEGVLNSAVDQLAAVPGVTTVIVRRISGGSKQDSRVILEADKTEALGVSHVESSSGVVSISIRWLYESVAASSSPVSAEKLTSVREHGAPIVLVGTDSASPGVVE